MDWKGKKVFLTGASSGIGEGIALHLARKGAVLGLVARRAAELEALASRCRDSGGEAAFYPCDVTDAAALQRAADKFRQDLGAIDVMIANAGIGGNDEKTRGYDPDSVRRLIDINLLGSVNAVHAVLTGMLTEGGGQIVAISSLAGFRGLPRSAAYSASKAGMTAFFESVRLDVASKGIDVTIIQPGFIKTPLTMGRSSKMPFIMELDDAIPHFIRAIEKRKRFCAFPWQLATIVRAGRYMPGWMYDRIALRARYRE